MEEELALPGWGACWRDYTASSSAPRVSMAGKGVSPGAAGPAGTICIPGSTCCSGAFAGDAWRAVFAARSLWTVQVAAGSGPFRTLADSDGGLGASFGVCWCSALALSSRGTAVCALLTGAVSRLTLLSLFSKNPQSVLSSKSWLSAHAAPASRPLTFA